MSALGGLIASQLLWCCNGIALGTLGMRRTPSCFRTTGVGVPSGALVLGNYRWVPVAREEGRAPLAVPAGPGLVPALAVPASPGACRRPGALPRPGVPRGRSRTRGGGGRVGQAGDGTESGASVPWTVPSTAAAARTGTGTARSRGGRSCRAVRAFPASSAPFLPPVT